VIRLIHLIQQLKQNTDGIEGEALTGTLSNAQCITDKQTDVSDTVV